MLRSQRVRLALGLIAVCLVGCRAAMVQESLGVVRGFEPGRTGGAVGLAAGGVDKGDVIGLGVGGRVIVTDDVVVVADDLQLVTIGPRVGSIRLFGRVGLGLNLGWVDGNFGGGGLASAELGAVFGSRRCGTSLHASAWYLGRLGDAENEPFLGVHLGYACAYHKADARRSGR